MESHIPYKKLEDVISDIDDTLKMLERDPTEDDILCIYDEIFKITKAMVAFCPDCRFSVNEHPPKVSKTVAKEWGNQVFPHLVGAVSFVNMGDYEFASKNLIEAKGIILKACDSLRHQ